MALDFGDAGLFDPIPPSNNKLKNQDDENDNIHNGFDNDNEDRKDREEIEDEPEEEEELEDWPSAPPLDILDCIKGYEMVSFDATSVPPPPFEEIVEAEAPEGEDNNEDKGDEEDGIKAKVRKSPHARIQLTSIQYIEETGSREPW